VRERPREPATWGPSAMTTIPSTAEHVEADERARTGDRRALIALMACWVVSSRRAPGCRVLLASHAPELPGPRRQLHGPWWRLWMVARPRIEIRLLGSDRRVCSRSPSNREST